MTALGLAKGLPYNRNTYNSLNAANFISLAISDNEKMYALILSGDFKVTDKETLYGLSIAIIL